MTKIQKRGGSAVAERTPASRKRAPVRVSYPGKKETVSNPSYTVQIAVEEPVAAVELSIDRGDWLPCREAVGLWWYDWNGYDSGDYEFVARLRRPDGTLELSEPRIVDVRLV
jgi:hypothetical protein